MEKNRNIIYFTDRPRKIQIIFVTLDIAWLMHHSVAYTRAILRIHKISCCIL